MLYRKSNVKPAGLHHRHKSPVIRRFEAHRAGVAEKRWLHQPETAKAAIGLRLMTNTTD
jgi:hypothetical protein